MLIGQYSHNVDAKGRVFIPAKWRDDLGDTIIFTHGIREKEGSKCLLGMSVNAFEEFRAKISAMDRIMDLKTQPARRMLLANADDCELDKQGRVLLANRLRDYAGITKDVVLVGVDSYIEVWDCEAWAEYCRKWENGELEPGFEYMDGGNA